MPREGRRTKLGEVKNNVASPDRASWTSCPGFTKPAGHRVQDAANAVGVNNYCARFGEASGQPRLLADHFRNSRHFCSFLSALPFSLVERESETVEQREKGNQP